MLKKKAKGLPVLILSLSVFDVFYKCLNIITKLVGEEEEEDTLFF